MKPARICAMVESVTLQNGASTPQRALCMARTEVAFVQWISLVDDAPRVGSSVIVDISQIGTR